MIVVQLREGLNGTEIFSPKKTDWDRAAGWEAPFKVDGYESGASLV